MKNTSFPRWLLRPRIIPVAFLLVAWPASHATAASTGAGAHGRARIQSHAASASADPGACGKAGLVLPSGFCASIFADKIGHARHMVVGSNGVLYVNTWSGRYYVGSPPPHGAFLVALQDTRHRGRANVIRRFGETAKGGSHGGTGIALYQGYIYAELDDHIARYKMSRGSIVPTGKEEIVLSGLPLSGDHPMHPFVIDANGWLYVDVASATNACQRQNRMLESPGIDPCTELETRGGIWRYNANQLNQRFSSAERYATGIRNADGMAIDSTGYGLYSTQHGRDQLGQNWPKLFTPEQGAYLPAEELLRVVQNGNYGWPYCYYDGVKQSLELAPEYGGNGKTMGRCADMRGPLAAFPAHWAPNDLLLYYGARFPAHYHGGAFIAFHGSWNRAPFPQQGYNVVFQPLSKFGAACEIFADGFSGADKSPAAPHRPSGLAAAPDGAIYVSDDIGGRIWRITYRGGSDSQQGGSDVTPCPSMTALGTEGLSANALPPEGLHPNAGAVANLTPPPGATREMLELGDRVYHGQVAAATCTGCHGPDGRGTPLGPDLTSSKYLWGDGSDASIQRIVREGVAKPKAYRAPMPPMGGSQLSAEQLSAVSAYVWALSHQGSGAAH